MPTRVESHYTRDKDLFLLTHKSKNLYNCANYIVRQEFINTSREKEQGLRGQAVWIKYNELDVLLKNQVDYKALPRQTSQAILRLLDKNWKSFFKSIKDYKKNPGKYSGKPSLPKYKKKDGHYIAIYPGQNVPIKNGYIILPKTCGYKIKTNVKKEQLREVRLIPTEYNVKIEVVYEKIIEETNNTINNKTNEIVIDKANRKIGIDIGVNNLVAVTSNQTDIPSFLVNGRPVKSINQYYNKQLAKRKSILEKVNKKKTSKYISKLGFKRNMKIEDYFHKTSRYIVNFAKKHNVGLIIIGKNEEWKINVKMRKEQKQTFIQIPFQKLIEQITYKAMEYGIEVKTIEESYTSKIDHFAFEVMGHHDRYIGKRIKRGLFKSTTGVVYNADINGAVGIIRKEAGDGFLNDLFLNRKKNIVGRGSVFLPYKLCF